MDEKRTPLVRPETLCAHAGSGSDAEFHSLSTPVYMTSTFALKDTGEVGPYFYTREGNPTRAALERALAGLEGGPSEGLGTSAVAIATAAGVAAETTVLSIFPAGSHVIAGKELYGGTLRLFREAFEPRGLTFSFIDMRDAAQIAAAVRPETRCIWIETPTNPLLNLTDVAAVARIARPKKIVTVVDGTFASPYFQKPLALGADVVVHSTTKYLNGHSDVVGGAVIAKSEALGKKLVSMARTLGTPCSPFDAFLVLRGIKTLALRMQAHERNALALARFLETRREVERVYYPGLPSHPQHALAKRQMTGFGGMLAFDLKGGRDAVFALFRNLRLFTPAASLGGVESLISHPPSLSHKAFTPEERRAAGIHDGLVRVSAGIEHPDDLVADLSQALSLL